MDTITEQPLLVEEVDRSLLITLNRAAAKNSLNAAIMDAFHQALDQAEHNEHLRCVVIKGNATHFCTGMDFQEAINDTDKTLAERKEWNQRYMQLLYRLNTLPKVTICAIEGIVMAGGMGIVSACDLVMAKEQARFSLSEALWGLLPSMVLPYLMRRTGYQPAHRLTLTTENITAEQAERIHLVDIVTDNLERTLKQTQTRCYRLANETIGDLKRYMNQLNPITNQMQTNAIHETARLANEPRVQQNIANFIHHQQFPWEQ